MSEQEIYRSFMDWLKQTWYGLPEVLVMWFCLTAFP